MADFDKVQKLFDDALDLSAEARDDFVRKHGSANTAQEVMALLSAHADSEKFLTGVFDKMHTLIDGPAASDKPVLPSRIGHYQISELVGEGGMGVVFRAWDEKLQRNVAIKVLSGSRSKTDLEKERFIQEAKAAAQLNHPNVCEVYEINETSEGQLYIVTAFCEGEDMAKAIHANRLSLGQILSIIIQLCEALSVAHGKGIIHRDLKPANIIIDDHDHIKLVDFGIAKISGTDLSQTGQIIGTFSHMAPEQFSGGHIDQRTDIWAIGVLLFEAFTGSKPFVGDNPAAIMYQIFHGDFAGVDERAFPLASNLNHLLKRTINVDRQARYQTVEILISELRSIFRKLEQNNQLTLHPIKSIREQNSELSTITSLSEFRKVVTLGLKSDVDLEKNKVFLSKAKRIIRNHKGQIIKRTSSHIYAYFGVPLLREAQADHALACSIALCGLDTMNAGVKAALDHAPVIITDNQKTGQKEVVGNVQWQFDSLLNLNAPKKIMLTESVNLRLRRPLSSSCGWSPEVEGFGELYVLSENTDEAAFVAYRERYRNPLSGRVHELGMLEYTWRSVLEGDSRTVLLSGDAGMGKTRLLYELKQKVCSTENVTVFECQADPNHSDTILYPLINAFNDILKDIKKNYACTSVTDAMKLWLTDLDLFCEENLLTLAWLMKTPNSDAEYKTATETPEAMHKKCLQLVALCIDALSEKSALLLILEDLHWADSRTLDWLDSLLVKPIDRRVFIVITGRPELFLRWRSNTAITQLALNKLSENESRSLIGAMSRQQCLSEKLQSIILEKSAGNPLYIEEYTRMLMREHDDEINTDGIVDSIPDSIEDLVHAQLDYLGASKTVAQAASVIGRVFDSVFLHELLGIDSRSCDHLTANLVESSILYRKGDTQFAFKHALIRDALLNSIAKDDQKKLHKEIAQLYEKDGDSSAEVIAFHLSAADDRANALLWWLKAARQAQDSNAVRETIRLCRLGLRDIEGYLDTSVNTTQNHQKQQYEYELQFQIILGPALIAVSNYANSDVGKTYTRALELSEILDEEDKRFAAMMGLWCFCCVSAQHRRAIELAEMLVDFAERYDSDDLRVEAYLARGGSHLFLAKLQQSSDDLEKAIGCYDESMSAAHIRLYSQEPAMAIYTFRALLEEARGDGGAARAASAMAVEVGRKSQHPFSLGFSLAFSVHICLRQQKHDLAVALREEYKKLCEEQDIHVFKLLGALQEGLFEIASGKLREGITTIEEAIPPYMAFGTGVFVPSWYGILAMSYLQLGDVEKASIHLQKATLQIESTGEYLGQPLVDAVRHQLALIQRS